MQGEADSIVSVVVAKKVIAEQRDTSYNQSKQPDRDQHHTSLQLPRSQVAEREHDDQKLFQSEVSEEEHGHLRRQHGEEANGAAFLALHPQQCIPIVLTTEFHIKHTQKEQVDSH